jgi:branched-chain amino acid transport system ATP-binding protein
MPLLETKDLLVSYGTKQVLNGVDLHVEAGKVTTIIGHNGAGKSTLLKGVFGLARATGGSVLLDGKDIAGNAPYDNIKMGIAYLAQGGQVFLDLTLEENLRLGGYTLPHGEVTPRLDAICEMFPILGKRRKSDADTLSGGERQMLAIGMTLMLSPKLLLMDEPSGALAGPVVEQILATIRSIVTDQNVGVLLVEQNVDAGVSIADEVHMLEAGRVVFSGTPADLASDEARSHLLGLT